MQNWIPSLNPKLKNFEHMLINYEPIRSLFILNIYIAPIRGYYSGAFPTPIGLEKRFLGEYKNSGSGNLSCSRACICHILCWKSLKKQESNHYINWKRWQKQSAFNRTVAWSSAFHLQRERPKKEVNNKGDRPRERQTKRDRQPGRQTTIDGNRDFFGGCDDRGRESP